MVASTYKRELRDPNFLLFTLKTKVKKHWFLKFVCLLLSFLLVNSLAAQKHFECFGLCGSTILSSMAENVFFSSFTGSPCTLRDNEIVGVTRNQQLSGMLE